MIEKRCDATGYKLVGHDAGEGPMLVRTPDGYTIRVEVVGWPTEHRPHLREQAVKAMIEHNELEPLDTDDDSVRRLPVERRG